MKIRRILATAVAAAVTTPVVFLSAAPAFADTKPSPSPTQKSTLDDEDPEDMPSLEELKAAVALAQKAYDEAVVDLAKAKEALKAFDKPEHPLRAAMTEAKTAAEAAAAAKILADEKLAEAEKAVTELPADATEEQKAAAAAAVTEAKRVADEAAIAKTAADRESAEADKAFSDARSAASQVVTLAEKVKKAAAEDLAEAQEELKFYEEIGGECEVDPAVEIALSGPKTVTAGQPAVFSLRVTNTSDAPLDAVHAFADALRIPEDDEAIDEETDFADRMIPVEWSSADNLEWTSFTEEFDSIEIGKLAKGAHYDVKLRLTVPADATAGEGAAFSYAEYETNDGECGMGDYADVTFDILAAKGDKPKPEPTPTPSVTTTTPAPAPSTAGNTNTTPQGGSSTTRVNGSLAATGADDTLPLGLAAGAAVALGAGAVFFARRRKADANA
ncbi:LPXTG cell wall anchor domain-containing protein [Streptomyces exfoliatus]|uniref:LPXTG cell wall anchor domain-containing protein n=1 Tax=Streptomyces exfoliatus TaxID=1905 RepID=UPI0037ABF807